MLKLFYDWLVVAPADLIAGFAVLAIGSSPLILMIMTWWFFVVKDDRPKRISTYFIAVILSAYVFAVTGTAFIRLPHAYYQIVRDNDFTWPNE